MIDKMRRISFLLPLFLHKVLSAETQHITLTFQVKLHLKLTQNFCHNDSNPHKRLILLPFILMNASAQQFFASVCTFPVCEWNMGSGGSTSPSTYLHTLHQGQTPCLSYFVSLHNFAFISDICIQIGPHPAYFGE